MRRDIHNGLFGLLVIISALAFCIGMAWWFGAVFLPKIDWARMWSDFMALPGGVQMAIVGALSFFVILLVGKFTENYVDG